MRELVVVHIAATLLHSGRWHCVVGGVAQYTIRAADSNALLSGS